MSEEYTETTNGYSQVIEVEDCTMKNVCKYIKQLQQENQELKERINMTININRKNKELLSVLDEIREYINGAYEMSCYTKSISLDQENIEDILEILDKVGSNDNKE